ncbi:MAG TPA: hypothetical protein VGC54_12865, partial [Planctomycetota bacterium]
MQALGRLAPEAADVRMSAGFVRVSPMPTRLLAFFFALALAPLPGCVFLVGAAVGAGVVHATGEDTAELVSPAGMDE